MVIWLTRNRMTESCDYESVPVFIGVDVGEDTHHTVAVNRSGKRLFDKALPSDETKLRSLISDLKQHGQILLVVDQPPSARCPLRRRPCRISSRTDNATIRTPVKTKPMPVTRPSSPRPSVPCLTHYAH